MNTIGSLEHSRRFINGPPGAYDLDITDLQFTSPYGTDYEVLFLCGHGYVECNQEDASPPILYANQNTVRVVTLTQRCVVGIFPLIGRTKKAVA